MYLYHMYTYTYMYVCNVGIVHMHACMRRSAQMRVLCGGDCYDNMSLEDWQAIAHDAHLLLDVLVDVLWWHGAQKHFCTALCSVCVCMHVRAHWHTRRGAHVGLHACVQVKRTAFFSRTPALVTQRLDPAK